MVVNTWELPLFLLNLVYLRSETGFWHHVELLLTFELLVFGFDLPLRLTQL